MTDRCASAGVIGAKRSDQAPTIDEDDMRTTMKKTNVEGAEHRTRLYPPMTAMGCQGISAGPVICETCGARGSWSREWSGGRTTVNVNHKTSGQEETE